MTATAAGIVTMSVTATMRSRATTMTAKQNQTATVPGTKNGSVTVNGNAVTDAELEPSDFVLHLPGTLVGSPSLPFHRNGYQL